MKPCLMFIVFLVRMTKQQTAVQCQFRADAAEWGILYKKPSSQKAYVYDSKSTKTWETELVDVDNDGASVGKMISAVSKELEKHNVIAFSNFPPHARAAMESGSETRGALIYQDSNGTLLMHTVDQWPNFYLKDKYGPPPEAKAALIVCINIADSDFRAWGSIMDYQDPFIYFVSKTDNGLEKIDSLKKLLEPPIPKYSPYVRNEQFKSADKTLNFRIISKLGSASQDVYSTYMTVVLRRSLLVWSEQKTYKLLNSSCMLKYKVENVKPTKIVIMGDTIDRKDDTSSWAVSKGSNVFCMSSADRTEASKKAGAGVLCFENKDVHDMFKKMTNKAGLEKCH